MSQLGTLGNPAQAGFPNNLLAFVGYFRSWEIHHPGVLIKLPGGCLRVTPYSFDAAYVQPLDENHHPLASPRIVSLTKKEAKKLEEEFRRMIFGPKLAPTKRPKKARRTG